MTPAQAAQRDQRRAEFNAIFDGMPGTKAERVAKVCAILGYQPRTISVLRVKTKAYKVIPQAKIDILKRELQREADAAKPAE